MLKGSNKERLEQEIAHLIEFITNGREVFFKKTTNSISSSDEFLNYMDTIKLFQEDKDLIQLDLNIQLLYIKLSSYYDGISKHKIRLLSLPRNVFAHRLTDLVFRKKISYNFFLYKVSKNFKKIQYLFYSEQLEIADNTTVRTVELNLDEAINEFVNTWSKKS